MADDLTQLQLALKDADRRRALAQQRLNMETEKVRCHTERADKLRAQIREIQGVTRG